MAQPGKRSLWQTCRVYFRRFRIAVLLFILALVGALVYLNQIGLPDFVKKPLLAKLRDRGVDLQFTRLSWRLPHGIVAENVRFGGAGEASRLNLTAKELQVRLNYPALAKLRLQINSLLILRGVLTLAIGETNGPPRILSLENIQAKLLFLPDDLWKLQNFRVDFAGANIQVSGEITNASAIRNWKFSQGKQLPSAARGRLNQLADVLDQMKFASPPEVRADVRGDARDLKSFVVQLAVRAPGANTPWGTVTNGSLSARLFAVRSNGVPNAEASVTVNAIETRWGKARDLRLTGHMQEMGANEATREEEFPQIEATLSAGNIETRWGKAGNLRFTGRTDEMRTKGTTRAEDAPQIEARLVADNIETRWGNSKKIQFTGRIVAPGTNVTVHADETWAWWTNAAPYWLNWECRLEDVDSPRLNAGDVSFAGQWRAPELAVSNLSALLYGGSLQARFNLNVATRELGFATSSDFDIQKMAPLLTEGGRQWLSRCSWQKPPIVKGEGALTLPAWTNRQPDWRAEVQPTVRLKGEFQIGNAAFRGVTVASANSHFNCTNMFWSLPDLTIVRPEGRLNAALETSDWTESYHLRIRSAIDPLALRPLLDADQQRGLDAFTFAQPPAIDAEIWGRWNDPGQASIKARVALTNFTFRGESADAFQTALEYTNQFLLLENAQLWRGTQQAIASGVGVDFAGQKVYLTNGYSTTEPMVIARAIGPNVVSAIEPYHFSEPPTVHVEGIIPMRGESDADLRFDVRGGPFEWWNFKVPRVSGQVHWMGERLTLSNVEMDFYQGTGAGSAEFQFHSGQGTDFHFDANVTNADFHPLMADLTGRTNRIEGKLTARLSVASGNTADWRSVQGRGHVSLRDGLIWEIPIFGVLSPALDSIAPGLGSSRASEASATFAATNGVIHSDDLEIRASVMRLKYWGTMDLSGKVDARVEAQLLRDTWVLGRLLSLALWPVTKICEYKITGDVYHPKSEPVFLIPRIPLMILHPIRTFKDMLPETATPPGTNAPPGKLPP